MSLSLVVRSRDSLVGAVALHGVLAAGELVGQHAADGLVQDAARGSGIGRNERKESSAFLTQFQPSGNLGLSQACDSSGTPLIPVMEGPSLGVDQATFAKVVHVLQLVAVEASGDVDTWGRKCKELIVE